MKLRILATLAITVTSITANAQTPVWSTDIAPILNNNCATCHRPGGIGSFSLLTYNDAVNKALAIAGAVNTGYMPPWPPDVNYNRLAHERVLAQSDIDKIVKWANGGTPQGDPNLAPPTPTFNPDGDLPGTPDLVTQIPTYTSTATTGDIYQCFVVPSNLTADKFITAFEAIPGNRDIVHHVLVYADTTGTCANLQANSSDPVGYLNFGGVGTDKAILLGIWVPGTQPTQMPKGFGLRIPKNADIVLQVHYPLGSNGKKDSTKIKFYFSPTSSVRDLRLDPILNHTGNFCKQTPTNLYIPAKQTQKFVQESTIWGLVGDVSILGVGPHMHLIGRSINSYGVLPNGDTDKYINIPKWDFGWQGIYNFRKIKKVPQGSKIISEAFYDNTSSNPFNPSNPPKDVSSGEATTDEMMLSYFLWTPYQAGDENIIIDSTFPVFVKQTQTYYNEQEFFAPYPNPASNQLTVKYYFKKSDKVSIDLVDIQGRTVRVFENNKKVNVGYTATTYNTADIPNGVYTLRMLTSEQQMTHKVIINR
ncbi:MAG: T9SS type A sorting domain-containing protein [Flavipsychrobacter sp.]